MEIRQAQNNHAFKEKNCIQRFIFNDCFFFIICVYF